MPQGISGMTVFVGAMMLGAIPAFLAYPNTKVEPAKYRSGLLGVTSNLKAKLVVIDEFFPRELLGHVSLNQETRLLRVDDSARLDATDAIDCSGESATHDLIRSDGIAFIQHSAGTTGLQKGVALTHGAVMRQIDHLSQALRIDKTKDRVYSWLPLYHDMGLIASFMLPMVCHLELVIQAPLEWVMHPATMLQIITEHKCTLAWLPNFAFQFIPRRTRYASEGQYNLSSLRALINCSEPIRASSIQEFERAFTTIGLKPGVLHTSYAMAETVFAVTQSEIACSNSPARIWVDGGEFRRTHRIVVVEEGGHGSVCYVSSGRLLPNVEVRVMPEGATGGPFGEDSQATRCSLQVGEIFIKSDCLFNGYYNRPDLTAEAFVDGWYRTGDLGFTFEGELYVIGRKKDLIIVGGENIYPQDIEEIVGDHPAIHEGRAVALGVYNPDTGTEDIIVVAEVESEELLTNSSKTEQELRGMITAGIGIAVPTILLKPPKWIVKSTAGKPARSATLAKLMKEHPEFDVESSTSTV
jgi:fatty-acyl-CoA synthase